MSDRIKVDKPLITPIYLQEEPNRPIELGRVVVKFDFQGTTYEKVADAKMVFLPDDRLKFAVPFEDVKLVWKAWSKKDFTVSLMLTENGITFDCHWATVAGDMVFSPMQSAITVTQPCSDISIAKFHLFNYPDFHGPESYLLQTGEPSFPGCKTCGRAILKANGWVITIAATDRTDDLEKQLKAQGGYAVAQD